MYSSLGVGIAVGRNHGIWIERIKSHQQGEKSEILNPLYQLSDPMSLSHRHELKSGGTNLR